MWKKIIWYAGEIKPDCSWWSNDFPIMVMELKNSCGVSGDAFIQCVVVYSKIIAQDKVWCPISAAFNPVAYFVFSSNPSGSSVISLSS